MTFSDFLKKENEQVCGYSYAFLWGEIKQMCCRNLNEVTDKYLNVTFCLSEDVISVVSHDVNKQLTIWVKKTKKNNTPNTVLHCNLLTNSPECSPLWSHLKIIKISMIWKQKKTHHLPVEMNIFLYVKDAPRLLYIKSHLICSQIGNKYEILCFLIDYLKYQHLLLTFLKQDTLLVANRQSDIQ